MDKSEFDQFADEYEASLADSISLSGEDTAFFHEYKVADTAKLWKKNGVDGDPSVLDFGCGVGNSSPFFRQIIPGSRVTGVDVSLRSVEIAMSRFGHMADFVDFDGVSLPFENSSFDIVFTSCVFHHIPSDAHIRLMREIYRVLTKGGMFVIFEHNPYNPLTRHVVNSCPFDENAVLIRAKAARSMLAQAGFDGVYSRYRVFFPNFLKELRFLEKWLEKLPIGAQYFAMGVKE